MKTRTVKQTIPGKDIGIEIGDPGRGNRRTISVTTPDGTRVRIFDYRPDAADFPQSLNIRD